MTQAVVHGVHPTTNVPQPIQSDGSNRLRVAVTYGASTTPAFAGDNADNVATGSADRQVVSNRNFIFNGSGWDRLKKPSLTARLLSSLATTNAALVRNAATDLFRLRGYNAAATPRFLKLYNKATAPVAGTDTPVATFYLPPTAPFELDFETPMYFATGFGYAITGAAADSDTTVLAAGDILCMNISYG